MVSAFYSITVTGHECSVTVVLEKLPQALSIPERQANLRLYIEGRERHEHAYEDTYFSCCAISPDQRMRWTECSRGTSR